MNLQLKDKLNSFFAISNVPNWLDRNANKPLTSYCIVLNFGADIEMEIDLNRMTLKSNTICFLNPGSYVSSLDYSDESHYFIEFNSAFYCLELHDRELSCNGLLFGALPFVPVLNSSTTERQENIELLNMIIKEFEFNDQTRGDMLRLLLKRLIIFCVRIGRTQLFKTNEPQAEDTDIVRTFQAIVEKHFREKHKVSDYADIMFKSPKTLSNTFKKLGIASPLQIIQERIILEAKRQIYYTDKPIKEIAYSLGFSEPGQFSRLFKNITGTSPSEFHVSIV